MRIMKIARNGLKWYISMLLSEHLFPSECILIFHNFAFRRSLPLPLFILTSYSLSLFLSVSLCAFIWFLPNLSLLISLYCLETNKEEPYSRAADPLKSDDRWIIKLKLRRLWCMKGGRKDRRTRALTKAICNFAPNKASFKRRVTCQLLPILYRCAEMRFAFIEPTVIWEGRTDEWICWGRYVAKNY